MRLAALCVPICFAALGQQPSAAELPIAGLAGVGLLTSDLEKARGFFSGTLGYTEAFGLKDQRGRLVSAFFKVNDAQYIQVSSGLQPGYDVRMTHVAIETGDVQGLRKLLLKRGIIPSLPAKNPEGGMACEFKDPDGTRIQFVEYASDSLMLKSKGKFLGAQRISSRLWHAGVLVAREDAAIGFYRDKLGFTEFWRGGPTDNETRWINLRMPGTRGDYLELMLYSEAPSREQLGSMQHICLQVPDIKAAVAALEARGVTGLEAPRIGRNGRWQLNLYDPDGTRVELMEARQVRK